MPSCTERTPKPGTGSASKNLHHRRNGRRSATDCGGRQRSNLDCIYKCIYNAKYSLTFEWDENKNVVNQKKHEGISFKLIPSRSEEHTSELQSRRDLVCRLLLEKKKKQR